MKNDSPSKPIHNFFDAFNEICDEEEKAGRNYVDMPNDEKLRNRMLNKLKEQNDEKEDSSPRSST